MITSNKSTKQNNSTAQSNSTEPKKKWLIPSKTWFIQKETNQPTLVAHILTICVLSGITIGSHTYLDSKAENLINSWELRPVKCEKNPEDSTKSRPVKCERISNVEPNVKKATTAIKRLEEQLDQTVSFSDKNLNILIDLAKIQFISIWMSSGAFVIAGICGFRISKDGWKETNNILFTVFTVTMIIGVSYQRSQEFLKIETNIQSNFKMHQHNRNIEMSIRSYFRTGKRFNKDKLEPIDPIAFIDEIDKKISE